MNPTITTINFDIKTPAYEGPLEVVLDLIESRKLLVNDLALGEITDAFIAHVRAQEAFPVEQTASFVQLAATLLLIKSKSLIPDLTLTPDEQEDVDDLKRRLAAYERFREAARELGRVFGRQTMIAPGMRILEPMFAPSRDCTTDALAEALAKLLAAREETEKMPEARVKPMVTIEEMMERLAKRVQESLSLSWNDFSKGGDTSTPLGARRIEIIVSFLALLELVKQGSVSADQHEAYGDIRISHTESTAVPRYG